MIASGGGGAASEVNADSGNINLRWATSLVVRSESSFMSIDLETNCWTDVGIKVFLWDFVSVAAERQREY